MVATEDALPEPVVKTFPNNGKNFPVVSVDPGNSREADGGGARERDRVYCAKALMEILEEPAKLAT